MRIIHIVLCTLAGVLSSCTGPAPQGEALFPTSLDAAYQKLDDAYHEIDTLRSTRIPNDYFVHLMFVLSRLPAEHRESLSLETIDFDTDTGKIDLLPVAKADLKRGRFNILITGGLSPLHIEDHYMDMEKRFGVRHVPFGVGCVTHVWICEAVEQHNALVRDALAKKYGRPVLQQEFEAWLAKQRKAAEPGAQRDAEDRAR